MSNIIDSIQISGVTYTIQGSGGGGKAIEAGRGITITTGETADTVSFNLPISAGTGTDSVIEGYINNKASGAYSHAEGNYTKASGMYSHAEAYRTTASGISSHAEGQGTTASGSCSHAEGLYTTANNKSEHASGQYNVSSSNSATFGDSGNTLFSVGNGTSAQDRHNAFEIRQNGDIYLSSGGTDIKLQDHLGGGGSVTVDTELDSGLTNPVQNKVIYNKIDEVEEVTAAALNELNEAVSGKQDTLSAGTNITIVDNVISAEGGGKAIEAGRGITITTGETADTVSFNLPIYSGSGKNAIAMNHSGNIASGINSHAEGNSTTANGNYSHAEGGSTTASGNFSHAEGVNTTASGINSHAEGRYTIANGFNSHTEGLRTIANNESEYASGQYNISNSASTTFGDSGNTLFSVGNGTGDNARHNAFEIRQNGDIYLSSGGTDIKLQDQLGGSSITVDTALDSGSTNPVENRVIYNKIDEVEQVTAAALNNINDRLSEDEEVTAAGLNALNDNFGGLKLVKLTQAEYNALATKDSSTLYIIVN